LTQFFEILSCKILTMVLGLNAKPKLQCQIFKK
jgi:hypothetical protein